MLTNGVADIIWQQGFGLNGSGGGNGNTEVNRFTLPAGNFVDFSGYTIDDIKVSITGLTFNNFNGGFWSSDYDVTVEGVRGVAAAAPEPGTLLLLGTASVLLGSLRLRRKAGIADQRTFRKFSRSAFSRPM